VQYDIDSRCLESDQRSVSFNGKRKDERVVTIEGIVIGAVA
jgi:hypothetical protein